MSEFFFSHLTKFAFTEAFKGRIINFQKLGGKLKQSFPKLTRRFTPKNDEKRTYLHVFPKTLVGLNFMGYTDNQNIQF
jgi:hypothetical protein